MNVLFHPGMTVEKWGTKRILTSFWNIASELSRARSWIKEHETEHLRRSLEKPWN